VSLARGNDTMQGSWIYVGDNTGKTLVLRDFGASDYFNLSINDTNLHPDTFQAGASLVVKGQLAVAAGTYDARSSTTQVTGPTAITGGTYRTGTAAQTLLGGLVLSAGAILGSTGTVNAAGVSLMGGALLAPTLLNDSGNWSLGGGTFTANHGTVVFNGVNQQLTGSSTFFNLSKTITAADTLTFQAGATQTVLGMLTLRGAVNQLLSLRSATPGTPWLIAPPGNSSVSFVDVLDSTSTALASLKAINSKDSGNNTNWSFVSGRVA
jgi:hypothetical protein